MVLLNFSFCVWSLTFLTILVRISEGAICGDGSPDQWLQYKDEKCIRFIDQFVTHVDAKSRCIKEFGADEKEPLLTIKSAAEQDFFNQWFYDKLHIVDNVWLGGTRVNEREFEWSPGSPIVDYNNWGLNMPSNDFAKNCTQLTSRLSARAADSKSGGRSHADLKLNDGQWTDVSCLRRNLMVCQRAQSWSMAEMQGALLELRRNPVPIGFVYVQLPLQPEPQVTWPNVLWTEVTGLYAGLFFRADGGGGAPFGTVQEANSTRLTGIQEDIWPMGSSPAKSTISFDAPGWSDYVETAGYQDGTVNIVGHKFHVSDGENRPRNTAVRIFKRIR